MNMRAALMAPWRASSRSERALALTLMVTASAVGGLLALHIRDLGGSVLAAVVLAVGIAPMWLMVMPKALVLAVDGRTLRLPGVQREAAMGVLLYGVVSVAVPTLLLAVPWGQSGPIAALLALACTGCFAAALLPRYQVFLAGGAWIALANMSSHGLPGPTTAGFVGWAIPAVVALIAIAALNWRRALRSGRPRESGWGLPLIVPPHSASRGTTLLLLRAFGDTRGSGPRAPLRSLRIALGGMHLPRPWPVTAGFAVPLLVLPAAVIAWQMSFNGAEDVPQILLQLVWGNALMVAWLGAVLSGGLVSVAAAQLRKEWVAGRPELGLLALLPGLHHHQSIQRNVVFAALLTPARYLALLTMVVVIAAMVWHASAELWLVLLLTQLGLATQLAGVTLSILGQRPLRPWVNASCSIACFLLAITGYLAVLVDATADGGSHTLLRIIAMLWLTMVLGMAWLGRRGWRGLHQLPHPFVSA